MAQRKTCQQFSLVHIQMRFGANNQLSVEPMIDLYQEAMSETPLSAGDSIIPVIYRFSSVVFTVTKPLEKFIMFIFFSHHLFIQVMLL